MRCGRPVRVRDARGPTLAANRRSAGADSHSLRRRHRSELQFSYKTLQSSRRLLYPLGFLAAFETASSDLERLRRLFFFQMRNPPANALALFPARQPEGNFFRFFTFPPPRTTSS